MNDSFLPNGDGESEALSVGAFLDIVNESFSGFRAAIRGEIFGLEERRGISYFSLKDGSGDGMLACVLFRSETRFLPIPLSDGMEVIVEGTPHIWKPRGKFSFRVQSVRFAGEGLLKKAYDALRARLLGEGLFDAERKRALPNFPRRIALLTSREGAAIGDFMANIARRGFVISLFDAHVEGRSAVPDLVEGLRCFNRHPSKWDALVVVRGGGSLESLEAFNDERVVRAIAGSRIPTVAGIGHEKDISLASLSADIAVSTPTAAAECLGVSWEQAEARFASLSAFCLDRFREAFLERDRRLRTLSDRASDWKASLTRPFARIEREAEAIFLAFSQRIDRVRATESLRRERVFRRFDPNAARRRLESIEARIRSGDPRLLLAKGYGILRKDGRVLRTVADFRAGEVFEAILSDGIVEASVRAVRSKSTKG